MKKAVFFDIDGTLWDNKMQIPESTIHAIRALRANGNYAFVCSGRSRSNIRSKELLGIGFDGIVAGCGTYIEMNGKIVFQELLTQEQIQFALEELDRYKMQFVLEGPVYTYLDSEAFPNDPYVIYLKKTVGDQVIEIDRDADMHYEVNKMSASIKGEHAKEVMEQLQKEYDVIVHGEGIVELVPKGFSKASAMEKVCEFLHISKEDTFSFGDSANDLEMLKYAGNGIAMGNGTKEAKEAADYITSDINENGIRNGLEHFGLI